MLKAKRYFIDIVIVLLMISLTSCLTGMAIVDTNLQIGALLIAMSYFTLSYLCILTVYASKNRLI